MTALRGAKDTTNYTAIMDAVATGAALLPQSATPQFEYTALLDQQAMAQGYDPTVQNIYIDLIKAQQAGQGVFEHYDQYPTEPTQTKPYVDDLKDFEKWMYGTYGFEVDKSNWETMAKQYNYNKAREDAGLFTIDFDDPAYDPDAYNTLQNEYHQFIKKELGKKTDPRMAQYLFPEWINEQYAEHAEKQQKAKADLLGIKYKEGTQLPAFDYDYESAGYEYEDTPDDQQRKQYGLPPKSFLDLYDDKDMLAAGEAPPIFQKTQKFIEEYNSFIEKVQRYVRHGEADEESIKELYDKYDTFYELDEYYASMDDAISPESPVLESVLEEAGFGPRFLDEVIDAAEAAQSAYSEEESAAEEDEPAPTLVSKWRALVQKFNQFNRQLTIKLPEKPERVFIGSEDFKPYGKDEPFPLDDSQGTVQKSLRFLANYAAGSYQTQDEASTDAAYGAAPQTKPGAFLSGLMGGIGKMLAGVITAPATLTASPEETLALSQAVQNMAAYPGAANPQEIPEENRGAYNLGSVFGSATFSVLGFGAGGAIGGAALVGLSAYSTGHAEAFLDAYENAPSDMTESERLAYADTTAAVYGVITGTAEATLERSLGAPARVARQLFTRTAKEGVKAVIGRVGVRAILNWLANIGGEVLEETTQDVISNALRKAMIDAEQPVIDPNQLGETALYSGIVAAVLGAAGFASDMRHGREAQAVAGATVAQGDAYAGMESQQTGSEIIDRVLLNGEQITEQEASAFSQQFEQDTDAISEQTAPEAVQAPQTATEPEPSIVPETSTTQPTRPVTPHDARYASGEVLTFQQGKGDVQVRTVSETARAAFTDLEQKTMRELERVGKTLGVTVQWAFDIQHSENGAWAQDNGMYDPESNTLYISWESATADGGAPYAAVLGHEIAHSLENTQAYNTIMKYAVSKAKASGAYNAKMAALRERYGDRSETYLHQELVADTVQEVFTNPAELRRLVNSRRGVIGAILNAIDTILGKFKNGNAEISRLRQMLQDALDERQSAEGEDKSMRRAETDQTETEAFKKWFGDSVVVDKQGNPKVVYHGTPQGGFSVFDKSKLGSRGEYDSDIYGSARAGFYFAEDVDYANVMAASGENGRAVYPVYLSIQNPLRVVSTEIMSKSEVDAMIEAVKKGNHDGIIDDLGQHVVFNPSQIKSATANVGTFDADNPDIRFSRRTSNIPGSVLENPNLTEQSADTIKVFTEHGAFDYTQSSNKKDMAAAMEAVQKDGVDIAVGKIREKVDSGKRFNSAEMAYIEAALMAANAQKNTKAVMRILGDLRVIATEMGQNIQILRLLKTLAPADRHSTVQRMVDLVQHNVDLYFNKKNRKGQRVIVQADPALMQNLLEAATTKEADTVERLIREDLNRQIPSTLMDKINAWRYLSMLGNVKTHVRNIFGNATMYLLSLNKDLYGAVMETLANAGGRITGRNIERTKSLHNPISKLARDARAFAVQDADQMKDFLQGGGKETNISMDRTIFETRWLEWTRKHAMEFLEIEDWWFLSANYRKALTGYMIANRLTPGQMTGKVLDKGRLIAIREAQRNTFRDASDAANALNKFVRNHPVGGVLVEGLMPFKRTPINILKRGAEYSPLGLVRAVYRVSKGQLSASEFIDSVSASLAGSGMLILGVWLKSLGLIRASGEDKDREEYFERLKGHQAYALEIGDYSLTLDWLNPVNIPLFMGAELASMLDGSATGVNYAAIMNMLATVADPMTQMSMLQGINNALGSFKTDDKAGAIGNLITSSVYSYLGQYVPTLFGQLSRTLDDVRRDTYAASDSAWTREGERFARKLMNKVPGMSYMLEPYVDMWGLPEQDGKNWAMRAIENMVLPWWGKQVNNADPVNIELERLYVKTGDIGVLPKYPQNYHSVNGTTYRVKSDEIDDYRKDYGQTAKEALENLIDIRPYDRLPDENKAAVVAQIYSFATAYAKDESSLPYSVPKDMRKAFSAKRKRIAPEVYFLFRELAGLDGSISQESAKVAIDRLPKLTNTQRAWLWWSANTSWDASKNPYISGYKP